MAAKYSHRDKGVRSTLGKAEHPHSVPIIALEETGDAPNQPFAEGARDTIDADLRHRMISEAA